MEIAAAVMHMMGKRKSRNKILLEINLSQRDDCIEG